MCPNPQFTANLVTFTKKILHEKFRFFSNNVCGNLILDTPLQLIPEVHLEPTRTSTTEFFCEFS